MDWRHRAACVDPAGADLFFPVGDDGPALKQIAAAKSVCRRCLVATQCRDEALAGGYEGIWGGTTEQERRVLRRTAPVPVTPAHLVGATAQAPARVS